MSRKGRLPAALALAAMVTSISACGSSAPAGTSSATTPGRSTGSGANSTLAHARKGVKFAECMRSHGVPQFPDPGASGKFTIDQVANGSSLDTSTPAFRQAMSACQDLEPAGFTGGLRSAAQQSGALRFAACIRENGVKDFPDPVNGHPLVDTNRIPSANAPGGMSILQAAMQKCRGLGTAAGVTR
jgi:hypothetical protein